MPIPIAGLTGIRAAGMNRTVAGPVRHRKPLLPISNGANQVRKVFKLLRDDVDDIILTPHARVTRAVLGGSDPLQGLIGPVGAVRDELGADDLA